MFFLFDALTFTILIMPFWSHSILLREYKRFTKRTLPNCFSQYPDAFTLGATCWASHNTCTNIVGIIITKICRECIQLQQTRSVQLELAY